MRLTVSDAAELLRTPEKQIYRWIDEGELPCVWISERPHFNRTELLEWAMARGIPVSVEPFRDETEENTAMPNLAEALTAGGVHKIPGGPDRDSVLRQIVGVMKLPEDADAETLLQVLIAREISSSTGIGDGIAIPHVRHPVALNGATASIAVCYLDKPCEFRSPDLKPVHTIFFMVSPTIRAHLQLLAKLAAALHDKAFKAAVLKKAGADELLKEARRIEAAFPKQQGAA